MKILIVTNMYPTPEAPWLGAFVREQELSLRGLGIDVEVAAHIGRDSRWNYARALPHLVTRIRRGGFDLVHTHHTYSTLVAMAARRLASSRIPIIETFHESEIFDRGTRLREDALRRLRHWRGPKAWALRHADFVIPVQRDMLPRVLGAAASRVRSRVIPAGIDLSLFKPEPVAAARQRLGWDPNQLIVFFPCDPAKPEKRADLARAAFELFAREHPHARLVAAGSIPYARMPDHIKSADIILHPTDFEASPTVIKESVACERPVVATDTGDIRECFGDLAGVLICDWTAPDIARKLSAAIAAPRPYGGHERVIDLQLGLDQVAQRLAAVYLEVLPRRPSA